MSSYDDGKQEIVDYIKGRFRIGSTCLDVGACDGKWWSLLNGHMTMDAVEIFAPNVMQHNLRNKYRSVYTGDIDGYAYEHYDLILFGDVLEHMEVEKAQRVLAYAQGRCEDLIIGIPFRYRQGILYGNMYERHIQDDLTEELFRIRYPGYEMLSRPRQDYAYYHKGPGTGKISPP